MFHDPNVVGSWSDLAEHLDADGVVRRWELAEPELADVNNVDALLRAWGDPRRTNAALLSLVRLAATDGPGDDDALLLLLQLLSGVVWRLVGQLGDLSPDVTAVVLSELTCHIRCYRWRTRSGSVAANLEKDTRRAVLADLRPSVRRHPERGERLTWDGDLTAVASGIAVEDENDLDAVDLLLWAERSGVPAGDLALLVETECARDSEIPRPDDAVAQRHGISRRHLYRRRARTLTAIRAVAVDYLAAVA